MNDIQVCALCGAEPSLQTVVDEVRFCPPPPRRVACAAAMLRAPFVAGLGRVLATTL
jgi:hypothetical protein